VTLNDRIFRHASIDSTNLEAMRLVEGGLSESAWIVADAQTHGRGRSGRNWISDVGNLYATHVVFPRCALRDVSQISLVAALAVHDAASHWIAREHLIIKWPNDCLIDGAKFCGILVECCQVEPLAVAIGCGINVKLKPEQAPYAVACLSEFAASIEVEQVFAQLQISMRHRLQQWQERDGFSRIAHVWLERTHAIGSQMTVRAEHASQTGIFRGLSEDGALLLQAENGQIHRIYAGDVRVMENT
jgi:BirA family transcriptional regulator, biotin operon repressor / biotin---[acetyl-CoA-carboxylase] ligase